CKMTTSAGTCEGTETCRGTSSMWKGCTAQAPKAEVCSGLDADCNGQKDDGDPNKMSMAQGPQPPHSTWACVSGMCQLGACDPGWTAYPMGNPMVGCPCQVDANEPNGSCSQAKDM